MIQRILIAAISAVSISFAGAVSAQTVIKTKAWVKVLNSEFYANNETEDFTYNESFNWQLISNYSSLLIISAGTFQRRQIMQRQIRDVRYIKFSSTWLQGVRLVQYTEALIGNGWNQVQFLGNMQKICVILGSRTNSF